MQLHIILVEPARAENVGAAARAMKTMGFTSLRIVNSDAHLQPSAKWVAHGSTDILDNCQCFPSLAEALQDIDFTVASTARHRSHYHYLSTPKEVEVHLSERQNWSNNIALVFGREDSGLTNDELALADLLAMVPMVADYPSLNLGQAVMIFCYQLQSLNIKSQQDDNNIKPNQQLNALRQRFERLIQHVNDKQDDKLTEWLAQRLGFLQARDVAMLHTLLNDIEKKLNK